MGSGVLHLDNFSSRLLFQITFTFFIALHYRYILKWNEIICEKKKLNCLEVDLKLYLHVSYICCYWDERLITDSLLSIPSQSRSIHIFRFKYRVRVLVVWKNRISPTRGAAPSPRTLPLARRYRILSPPPPHNEDPTQFPRLWKCYHSWISGTYAWTKFYLAFSSLSSLI